MLYSLQIICYETISYKIKMLTNAYSHIRFYRGLIVNNANQCRVQNAIFAKTLVNNVFINFKMGTKLKHNHLNVITPICCNIVGLHKS